MYGILDASDNVIARFVTPLTVRNNKPAFVSDSLSLKRNVKKRSTQRWEIEARLEPLEREANELFSHLVLNSNTDPFYVYMPQNRGVVLKRTNSSTTPTVTGSIGASSVTVASNTGIIPKGCFVKFGTHDKIYMATSTLSGNGTLNIFPVLRAAVSAVTLYYRDDVKMYCLYDTDTLSGMLYEDGVLMDVGVVKLIEKL
jgi:hypothetical protein